MSSSVNNTQVRISFDYKVLELENRNVVWQRTEEIKERLHRAAQDIWEIGQKLAEVRSRLKHGQFETWLKAEFGWSHRTAYNFINVYEAFGKPANFAEIDIAASALYLLAAPSTPENIRTQFVQRARAGEKITYKNVRNTIKEAKPQFPAADAFVNSLASSTSKPDLIEYIPKNETKVNALLVEVEEPESNLTSTTIISNQSVQPGWHLLDKRHLLFCGDTASPQFFERIPQVAFCLAIPDSKWHHDWLINKARTVTILRQSVIEEKLLERLLLMHSNRGEAVIFPWLPNGEIIAVVHRLERQIYAGDSNYERCKEAIIRSGLSARKVIL